MLLISDLKRWLDSLSPENYVAIDDDGLTLREIDRRQSPTESYLEVGGEPAQEPCSTPDCRHFVQPDDSGYATPCGTFCDDCLVEHMRHCEICRKEFLR